jgi:S-adenosylmethionine decarboxylase
LLALGKHLILELKDCDPKLLDDLGFIKESMLNAARETGATVIGNTFHKFSPQGVTGVVAIAESHLCIHTWPEYNYAAADIFTCGESFDPSAAADIIIENLKCKTPSRTELTRGILPQLSEMPTY